MAKRIIGESAARIASTAGQQQLSALSLPELPAKLSTNTSESTDLSADGELIIDVRTDYWVQYEGPAAQLQAEGLIPQGFDWPRAAADKRWKANGFDYWLCRTRPKGHKGPMHSWLELDNWFVRVEVTGRDFHWRVRRHLERKAEELRAECHRHTAAGQREWCAQWSLFCKSREDQAFQSFKSMVPGLASPKRGRKPKPATQQASS